MALTTLNLGYNPVASIAYTHVTDSSADWGLVPNSTYFYDKADKLPHFKDASGTILEVFGAATTPINIYNSDGTVSGPRVVDLNTNGIIFQDPSALGQFQINLDDGTTKIGYFTLNGLAGNIGIGDNTGNTGDLYVDKNQAYLQVIDGVVTRKIEVTPTGVAINGIYTLPNIDGGAFQTLTTDGAGNLYWSNAVTPSSAFMPPVEQSEIRRGTIAISGSTNTGAFGGITPILTGSAVAVSFGGIVPLPKLRLLTTVGATNSTVGINYGASGIVNRLGKGFRFIGSFIYSDQSAGGTNWFVPNARQFIGLATGLVLLPISSTNTVDTRQNIIGMGSDASDTNLQIFHNNTSATATKIDLGPNFPANKTGAVANGEAYQLELYNVFGSSAVKYRVRKLSDGTEVTGTISTNLPSGAVDLAPQVVRTSGSTSQNVSIDVIQLTTYTRE
jgi:hypothetical protein